MHYLYITMNTQYYIFHFPSPDKLAEGLVVSEGAVVFLSKDVVNVFHAPGLQQLGGAFRLKAGATVLKRRTKREKLLFTTLLVERTSRSVDG